MTNPDKQQPLEPLIPMEEARMRLAEQFPGTEVLHFYGGDAVTVEQFDCMALLAETLSAKNENR